ncbi:MAG TPA: class I SAM-dependent methyltransferase [Nitrospiraceae bacterium]|nr:class I SAM-dependent methyltransferase [Nitrospiraceae bacterium]
MEKDCTALTRLARLLSIVAIEFVLLIPDHIAFGQHGPTQHRRPADVREYLDNLNRPDRDRYQKPSEVMSALRVKPGMAVADIGAGSGYFTRRFAEAVTNTGKVYAVDVEPEMLAYIKKSLDQARFPHTVDFILAQPDDPKLLPDSVDLIFMCNVYHHVEKRSAYFTNLRATLRPEGRVAIIDFYHDERSGDVGFPRHHLVPRETVIDEMAKAGYALTREHTFLNRQYFLEFAPPP